MKYQGLKRWHLKLGTYATIDELIRALSNLHLNEVVECLKTKQRLFASEGKQDDESKSLHFEETLSVIEKDNIAHLNNITLSNDKTNTSLSGPYEEKHCDVQSPAYEMCYADTYTEMNENKNNIVSQQDLFLSDMSSFCLDSADHRSSDPSFAIQPPSNDSLTWTQTEVHDGLDSFTNNYKFTNVSNSLCTQSNCFESNSSILDENQALCSEAQTVSKCYKANYLLIYLNYLFGSIA